MRAYEGCEVIHDREEVEGVKRIEFLKGLCAADPTNPDTSRSYEDGLRGIEEKIRYSGSLVDGNCLLVYCGVTDWPRYKKFYDMSEQESLKLQKLGLELYGDRYAFHSRAAGLTVMLKTRDGRIPVGMRNNPEYTDFLHGPAANYFRFETIDNCVRLGKIPSEIAMQKEIEWGIKQEVGLNPEELVGKAELFGVSCHPKTGEVDISLLQQTTASNEYFTNGDWEVKATNPKEYKEMFLLRNREDVKQVLQEFNNILYSTRLILENLNPDDFRPVI